MRVCKRHMVVALGILTSELAMRLQLGGMCEIGLCSGTKLSLRLQVLVQADVRG